MDRDRRRTQQLEKAKEDRVKLCRAIKHRMEMEGIVTPPDFLRNLVRNTSITFGVPSMDAIKGVIKMCRYWEKYCADENEFSNLVCAKIYSMLRIHGAAVVSNANDETCYIGNICQLKEGVKLPAYTCTSSTFYGDTIIQEGF